LQWDMCDMGKCGSCSAARRPGLMAVAPDLSYGSCCRFCSVVHLPSKRVDRCQPGQRLVRAVWPCQAPRDRLVPMKPGLADG